MTRFLLDENLPYDLAIEVTAAGHPSIHVYDAGLRGIVVARLDESLPKKVRMTIILEAIGALRSDDLTGLLVIVEAGGIRMRRA